MIIYNLIGDIWNIYVSLGQYFIADILNLCGFVSRKRMGQTSAQCGDVTCLQIHTTEAAAIYKLLQRWKYKLKVAFSPLYLNSFYSPTRQLLQ